jgi:methionyl-tRNA synthetase
MSVTRTSWYLLISALAPVGRARARRARSGSELRFLGGTDDYSLKNVLAAEAAGVPTAELVAANAKRFCSTA